MAPDPRAGLRRRPQFSELEARARKGNPKIVGLSYDPLRVLFDPLHVKMAQAMGEEAKEQTQRIIVEQRRQQDARVFASDTGIDPDFAERLMVSLEPDDEQNKIPKKDDEPEVTRTDEDDNGKKDDPPDPPAGNPPPPPGGAGGGGLDPEVTRWTDNRPPRQPPSRRPRLRTPPPDQTTLGGGPPPPSAGAASVAYREAVEVKAEIEALRQELQRQAQRQAMAEEIRRGMQVKNPVKEIIREIHQVPQPIFVPQAVPAPAVNTNQLMEAAKQAGVDIGMLTEKLAISRAQLAEALSRKPPEPEVAASSSTGYPPAPPPPPAARMMRSRSPPGPPPPAPQEASMGTTRPLSVGSEPPAKKKPQTFSMATPRERMASRQPSVITVNSSAKDSRASSLAPTVNYGPSPAASRQPSIASTVNYGPSRESSAKPGREASVASVASDATRSRSRGRPLLPIDEEPSRKETVRKVIAQMQEATVTNDAKVKASMRMRLSKFARSVAPTPKITVQQPKRAKSFDELAAEAEIMESAMPFGAATARQKTGPGVPDWQRRFQGRLVRPTSR